jgi:hypothetical protein
MAEAIEVYRSTYCCKAGCTASVRCGLSERSWSSFWTGLRILMRTLPLTMTRATILKQSLLWVGRKARPAVAGMPTHGTWMLNSTKVTTSRRWGALEDHTDQSQWGQGSRSDREADGSESGIGDQDGPDEQVPFIDWQNIGMV